MPVRCIYAFIALSLPLPTASALDPPPDYPEAKRLSTSQFYDGLKNRGLTDLLALHLREHPPASTLDRLLLARDIKLAEYADPSKSQADRNIAIAEANDILAKLITRFDNDKRINQWRLTLGKSLVHEEGERLTSSILYRGGVKVDRERLRPLMQRAVDVLDALRRDLRDEYEALDRVSAARYESMEAAGDIDKLEQDLAQSDYRLAWARFYHAVTLEPNDKDRKLELRLVLEYLEGRSNLLDAESPDSSYKAQSLLLAAMSERRLGQTANVRTRLGSAIDTVSAFSDEEQRRGAGWVVTLARIEIVRSLSDSADFEAAAGAIDVFKGLVERDEQGAFRKLLIIGLLSRSVHAAQADALQRNGQPIAAGRARSIGIEMLEELAERDPAYRDDVYATLFGLLEDEENIDTMTPFERCAFVAGKQGQAESVADDIEKLIAKGETASSAAVADLETRRAALIDAAADIAQTVIDLPNAPAALRAEAGFNLGVAHYRRGRTFEAAKAFLAVARDFREHTRAAGAAVFAVQLTWAWREDPTLQDRDDLRTLCAEALATLDENFPDTDSAKYWRFFRGQFLLEQEQYERAAETFAAVGPEHKHYPEAVYLAAEAQTSAAIRFGLEHPNEFRKISSIATAAIHTAQSAGTTINQLIESGKIGRQADLRNLAARTRILIAELCVMPRVSRWDRATETLDNFEKEFPDQLALIGRVLRVRMIALEAQGKAEQASQLIPEYVRSDPRGAVQTLQGLFDALKEDIERNVRAGREEEVRSQTGSLVAIARGLYDVAREQSDIFSHNAVYAIRIQLAEAELLANNIEQAKKLFTECVAIDEARYDDGLARDSRAVIGLAEAYYQSGAFNEALPLFNRVFKGSESGSETWWKSLLRDLQCRTRLEGDAAAIIKAIEQRRYLNRDLGGHDLRREFESLLDENRRRLQN